MRIRCRWVLLLILILGLFIPTQVMRAQDSSPIQVLDTSTTNDFPNGLTFNLHVQSDYPIVQITLFHRIQGDLGNTRRPIEFIAGTEVETYYEWDTSRETVPPSSPVYYSWVIEDEQGNKVSTPEELIYYDDLRFPWQEISDPDLIVRWYEGSNTFGQYVYQVAREALVHMKDQTGEELEFPIIVLIYANPDDFASWHFYVDTWVGGQAFTPLGVTTQIIPSSSPQSWIGDVIPHEIAHLFFYQVMDSPIASWPAWMNEGLAQYYELNDPQPALDRVAAAARAGTLLPLSSLSGGFGRDPDQVHLSYAQSLSVVFYILETWGDEGLQALIEVFRTGEDQRDGVETALGISWEQFEADWITWMGVPATPQPSPEPTATMVFPTAPSGWPTPTRLKKTATVEAPALTDSDTLVETETETEGQEQGLFKVLCGGSTLGALLLPVLGWVIRRKDGK